LKSLETLLENTQKSNIIKIRPVGAKSLHEEGWIGRQADRQTGGKIDRQTGLKTGRRTGIQRDRERESQTGRQRETQTDRRTDI